MRIIFVNRFYWPDEPATAQLLTDLAEAFAAAGHSPTVIASHPGGSAPAHELRRGVTIARIRGTRWTRFGILGKLADFARFMLGALCRLLVTVRPGDLVVVLTDPPLIGLGATAIARLQGAKVVHWTQDIYPEIAITLTGQRWLSVIRPLRDLAWRRADACVTLGEDMARVLRAAGVPSSRLAIIPNWAPAGLTPQPASAADLLRSRWNLTGKFVVLYSGNLGRVHHLEPLLDVAALLQPHPHIAFVFVGGGPQRIALMEAARRRGLTHLHFHPSQPREELAATLALGDVHIVTLRPGCEASVFPSKLYGIAAIGRPVLFFGPNKCELADLVRTHGFGHAFAPEETAAFAATVLELSTTPAACTRLGLAAAQFAAHSGHAPDAARRWAALAARVHAGNTPSDR